jgi:hypothetical protein
MVPIPSPAVRSPSASAFSCRPTAAT